MKLTTSATSLVILSVAAFSGCSYTSSQVASPSECIERQATSAVDDNCRAQCGDRAFRECLHGQWQCLCAAGDRTSADRVDAGSLGPLPERSCTMRSEIVLQSSNSRWTVLRECDDSTGDVVMTFTLIGSATAQRLILSGVPVGFSPDSRYLVYDGQPLVASSGGSEYADGLFSILLESVLTPNPIVRQLTNVSVRRADLPRWDPRARTWSQPPPTYQGVVRDELTQTRTSPHWLSNFILWVATDRGYWRVNLSDSSVRPSN